MIAENRPTTGSARVAPVAFLAATAARSAYPSVNIGRGMSTGLKNLQGANTRADQMEEREEEQEDTGNYRKANLGLEARKFSDAAKSAAAQIKREQARDQATAQYQQGELANQRTRTGIEAGNAAEAVRYHNLEAGKGFLEPSAPVMKDGKPVLDPDSGAPLYSWVDRQHPNAKPVQLPYSPETALGKPGAGGLGASQWKYHAWLAAHEGDTQGALDYAGGHRQMQDADVAKAAHAMASRDYHDLYVVGSQPPPKDPEAWLREKRDDYAQQMRPARTSAAQPGATQAPGAAATPTVSSKDQFDALPSGATYIGSDGGTYRKP